QLANHLRALGAGAGTIVGLCVDRSAEMVIGLLAIWKAGAAYLPLDPDYPAERLSFMIEDAGVKLLLTKRHLAPPVPEQVQAVHLDADQEVIAQKAAEDLPRGATPDDPAYVIYTSGSTGVPKGVMVRHRNLVNTICAS